MNAPRLPRRDVTPREPVHRRRTDGPIHVGRLLPGILHRLLLLRLKHQGEAAANAERARERAA